MHDKKVCVVGLGYIGLPTAALLATSGYEVIGVDVNQHVVDTINRGQIHIVEPDLDAYVSSAGHIGPLAVTQAGALDAAFTTVLNVAVDRCTEKISAFVPGTCEGALSISINHGMRISFPMLLMASAGYSSWTQYLPRNPGYM